jgi:hypothetical protein
MRDANIVSGQIITYKEQTYELGSIYFIENNPNLYVELIKNETSLNVVLDEIIPILISKKNKI